MTRRGARWEGWERRWVRTLSPIEGAGHAREGDPTLFADTARALQARRHQARPRKHVLLEHAALHLGVGGISPPRTRRGTCVLLTGAPAAAVPVAPIAFARTHATPHSILLFFCSLTPPVRLFPNVAFRGGGGGRHRRVGRGGRAPERGGGRFGGGKAGRRRAACRPSQGARGHGRVHGHGWVGTRARTVKCDGEAGTGRPAERLEMWGGRGSGRERNSFLFTRLLLVTAGRRHRILEAPSPGVSTRPPVCHPSAQQAKQPLRVTTARAPKNDKLHRHDPRRRSWPPAGPPAPARRTHAPGNHTSTWTGFFATRWCYSSHLYPPSLRPAPPTRVDPNFARRPAAESDPPFRHRLCARDGGQFRPRL